MWSRVRGGRDAGGSGGWAWCCLVVAWVPLPFQTRPCVSSTAQHMLGNQQQQLHQMPLVQPHLLANFPLVAGFGTDRGLGGKPAPDYCILECEQWNSPLCKQQPAQDGGRDHGGAWGMHGVMAASSH